MLKEQLGFSVRATMLSNPIIVVVWITKAAHEKAEDSNTFDHLMPCFTKSFLKDSLKLGSQQQPGMAEGQLKGR